jgi:hypothetical protein
MRGSAYPIWVRLPYTLFVAILVPVYWREYGPGNFLWFSDIALFAILISLWTGNTLLYSMMAIGVLPLELLWLVDFVSGGNLTGTAAYMFDPAKPRYLRGLSLFHLVLPALIIWMLVRQGYDRRAIVVQTVLAWLVLPATWLLTEPQENINWVHGFGKPPQTVLPPLVHLGLYMALVPVVVFLPMHWLLQRLFADALIRGAGMPKKP